MKIFSVNSILLCAVSLTVVAPVVAGENFSSRAYRGLDSFSSNISRKLAPVSAPIANTVTQKISGGVDAARQMWFCLKNPSQCSPEQVAKARVWIIGTSSAVVVSLLAAAGIFVTVREINKVKETNLPE